MDDAVFKTLITFFSPISLGPQEEHLFRSLWKRIEVPRGRLLTEAGKIERHFYFVVNGVQVLYLLSEKGEKKVLGFSYAGGPSGVFDSFVSQKPSTTFLEALKPSVLLQIGHAEYHQLFERHPELHHWGHHFFRDVLFGRLFREVELLTLSAEQRYTTFMERCPVVLQSIPQKYLASYLNMKPETFSRLRSSTLRN